MDKQTRAVYYNEIDPFCAQWLRNLMQEGHLSHGDIDTRDIRDVAPDDLKSYNQCHFFAGIGGWPYALALADFPSDREVWTGSCPCQPFSAAGQHAQFADERHLWPSWFHLIAQRQPATIFGEQVAAKSALDWFDLVWTDLEGAGYAVGGSDLCAAGVGAPHIRQRLWFVAHAQCRTTERWRHDVARASDFSESEARQWQRLWNDARAGEQFGELGNPDDTRPQGRRIDVGKYTNQLPPWSPSLVSWLPCTDGKARPVEPGTFPLAHGIPGRVGRLRAYGNAIVPQVAAAFIRATL